MSHSKRNTSRAVFTSHERALAKSAWSSNSARLNRDSFLPFGSCGLCLGISRDPVSCRRGDIFCRECALSNLLAQKKEIKRAAKARQHAEEESARARALDDEEDQQRAIQDFELTQAGLDRARKGKAAERGSGDDKAHAPTATGTKRKFSLDDGELERIAREDKVKARKAIEDEKATKPTLPSFWTPSLTPDVQTSKLLAVEKKGKAVPTCPASAQDDPHPLSMQNLTTINFREEDSSSTEKKRVCPSCLKVLSNSSNPMMAKQCGHVLCHNCVKQFMIPKGKQAASESQPPIACYVCDVPLTSKTQKNDAASTSSLPGLVALRSEGTGFSAQGTSTVKRSTIAFQC
ncbi:Fc.00g075890.m01.CDS01 [Cosmosporella sp. VM-42]